MGPPIDGALRIPSRVPRSSLACRKCSILQLWWFIATFVAVPAYAFYNRTEINASTHRSLHVTGGYICTQLWAQNPTWSPVNQWWLMLSGTKSANRVSLKLGGDKRVDYGPTSTLKDLAHFAFECAIFHSLFNMWKHYRLFASFKVAGFIFLPSLLFLRLWIRSGHVGHRRNTLYFALWLPSFPKSWARSRGAVSNHPTWPLWISLTILGQHFSW